MMSTRKVIVQWRDTRGCRATALEREVTLAGEQQAVDALGEERGQLGTAHRTAARVCVGQLGEPAARRRGLGREARDRLGQRIGDRAIGASELAAP